MWEIEFSSKVKLSILSEPSPTKILNFTFLTALTIGKTNIQEKGLNI